MQVWCGPFRRFASLLAGATLALLLLILPAGGAAAGQQLEPGPKIGPGVFLAKAPHDGSVERQSGGDSEATTQVVGGDPTTISEWPWQVAITRNPNLYSGNGFDRFFCGGSLVAPTIVITAAHCVHSSGAFQPVEKFASITGRTTLSDGGQGQEILWSDYFIPVDGSGNPLYKSWSFEWDVVFAVLESPSPSSSSTPIKLAGADEAAFWAPADENAWATGWGHTSDSGTASDTLREVNIDVIEDLTCGSVYGGSFRPETMVCAGELAGGQDTCQGDSGGPLVTPIGGGAFRLIGATSWGGICAHPNSPGVYARVAEDPVCSVLQNGIQAAVGIDVVGPGGCLPRRMTSFDPPNSSHLVALGFDDRSGNLFAYDSGQLVIREYTPSGSEVAPTIPLPGGVKSGSIDLDFAPEALNLSGTSVPANSLLVTDHNNGRALRAIDKDNGNLLAEKTALVPSTVEMVGGAYHAARDSHFVVDHNTDSIHEYETETGTLIGGPFPVRPAGSPAFGISYGDIEVSQATGNLLVVGSLQHRIRELSPTGEFIRDIDLSGWVGSASITAIAVDDTRGDLWLGTRSSGVSIYRFPGILPPVDTPDDGGGALPPDPTPPAPGPDPDPEPSPGDPAPSPDPDDSGTGSGPSPDDQQAACLDAKAELQSAKQTLAKAKARVKKAKAKLRKAKASGKRSAIKRAKRRLAKAKRKLKAAKRRRAEAAAAVDERCP